MILAVCLPLIEALFKKKTRNQFADYLQNAVNKSNTLNTDNNFAEPDKRKSLLSAESMNLQRI